MDAILAATRAIHFGSALLVFGELVFALFIAAPAWRGDAESSAVRASGEAPIRTILGWALAVGVVSDLLWLGLEVPLMSGEALADALHGPTLGVVLTQTWFGRVWLARLAFAIVLAAWLASRARAPSTAFAALAIAGAYLASPALAGHAAGGQGAEGHVRIGADMLHLLAAGAWVGALPALARLLWAARREALPIAIAARATRAFSTLGAISVGTLVASGAVSTIYLVRSVAALIDTEYGRLLSAKLVVAAAMLALAAANRWRLAPRLVDRDSGALRALARNTALEIAGGVAVVAIVGMLGITVPAMHPMHHGLHSDTSGAIILNPSLARTSWQKPTSSMNRFRNRNTTIWRHSSVPMRSRRTAWISRCSTAFSPRSSAVRS